MICAKCNAKNPDENLKCSNCGAPLQSDDAIDSFSGMKTSLNIENASGSFKKGDIFAGRYEILEDGLKGGMGMVYKVKDNTLGKISALKIILPAFLENVKAVSRFKQEVAISLDLNHENIVRVYDIGESEGIIYFTMEWVDGISLRDYINERKKHDSKPSYEEVLNFAKQLCSALSEAHKTITHRDIKPENIMVLDRYSQRPKIKITDFGIAKTESQALHVTVSSYMGTPIYMAPEQYTDAAHADKRADIYSIGVVLYEFMTFLHPLGTFPMPSEVNPSIPKKVDEIIRKALSVDRAMRYGDAMDIVKAIETPDVEAPPVKEKPVERQEIVQREAKVEPVYIQTPPQATVEKKKSILVPAIVGIILLIAAGLGYKLVIQGKGTESQLSSVSSVQTSKGNGADKPPSGEIVGPGARQTPPFDPARSQTQEPPMQNIQSASKTTETIETASIPPEKILTQNANVPLELQVNILGQRMIGQNDYEEVIIKNGSTLRSNDNFQINLQTSRDCYIYVLLYDSEGKASMLFPSSMAGTNNKIKGNKQYQIPPGNKWFFLDENIGTETIYILADINPMNDIDRLLASMESKGERQQKEDSQKILAQVNVLKRGVGGITTAPPRRYKTTDGDVINNVTQVVKGRGSLIWSVSFKHF